MERNRFRKVKPVSITGSIRKKSFGPFVRSFRSVVWDKARIYRKRVPDSTLLPEVETVAIMPHGKVTSGKKHLRGCDRVRSSLPKKLKAVSCWGQNASEWGRIRSEYPFWKEGSARPADTGTGMCPRSLKDNTSTSDRTSDRKVLSI